MTAENLKSLEDIELVKLTLSGDNQAFREIICRHEYMVARTIKGMLGDLPQSDDVGQETFIRLYNSLSEFRGDSKLGTYIQRIAINLSLNEIKRERRFSSLFYKNRTDDLPVQYELPSSDDEDTADAKDLVRYAMSKMNPEFRAVVTLRLLQGYSTKETADILNLPLGTALSRLSRAKEQLKEILCNIK